MSTPRNILDSYRSFSYHHIMVACDSMSAAEALADQGEITLFDADGLNDRYQPQQVPGDPGAGQYVIIFNGASDALFYISDINWTTYTVSPDDPRTAMTVGEMSIIEPKGARFLNIISNVASRLNVDSKGMVFLLKTVFTGYRNDGGHDLITTVDPFLFSMYDISAEFSVTGATYAISFSAAVNGVTRLPEVSAVAHGFSFQLDQTDDDTNTTVSQAMDTLQTKLNKRYQDYKQKLKDESECAGVEIDWESEFIDVEYRIQVDDHYQSFQVGTNEKFLKKNFGDTDAIIIQEGNTLSIEKLIEHVMMSSEELIVGDNPTVTADLINPEQQARANAEVENRDANNMRAAAIELDQPQIDADIEDLEELQDHVREVTSRLPKYTFKINSTVNSTPDRYIVTYHINRHRLPFNYRNSSGEVDTFIPSPDQGIVFDYIFTGQNVDILDFNMKMNMGQAFYQALLTSDSVPTASSFVNYKLPQTFSSGTGEINSLQNGKRTEIENEEEQSKKPLFLGLTLKQIQLRNKQNSGSTLAYDAMLQRFAMYESASTTVTIRGNPQLLAESTPLPSRLINNESVPIVMNDEPINTNDSPTTIMPQMWKQFGYAKINIQMPALNDDNPDFSEQFWYPGWYYIRQIDNSFQEGEFTQTLHINAIPTDQANQSVAGIKSCDEDVGPPESEDTMSGARGGRFTGAEEDVNQESTANAEPGDNQNEILKASDASGRFGGARQDQLNREDEQLEQAKQRMSSDNN